VIKFRIVADDLTGALDAGVQFSKQGLLTIVPLHGGATMEVDVIVADTESRGDAPWQAYEKTRDVARGFGRVPVFKKVDSTLRGNLGPELEALMDELAFEKAIVAPAFPANGRTTLRGQQLIHGLPLKRTSLAADPLCPKTDYLPALLSLQARRRVAHIDLGVVQRGPTKLAEEIRRRSEEILAVDATKQSHLRTIAQAIRLLGNKCVSCGSAGLAQELPGTFHLRGNNWVRSEKAGGGPGLRVLVVAGSRHPTTIQQLEEVHRELGAEIVEPETTNLVDKQKRSAEIGRIAEHIGQLLREKGHAILAPVFGEHLPGNRREIASALGAIVKLVAEGQSLSALFLTGGETAINVCRALGVAAIQVEEEVSPGIPAGTVLGQPCGGVRLVTKAGGFGDKKAITKAIAYLGR
jgi:uncharacterized protein YgbK (DUF1537 family)